MCTVKHIPTGDPSVPLDLQSHQGGFSPVPNPAQGGSCSDLQGAHGHCIAGASPVLPHNCNRLTPNLGFIPKRSGKGLGGVGNALQEPTAPAVYVLKKKKKTKISLRTLTPTDVP